MRIGNEISANSKKKWYRHFENVNISSNLKKNILLSINIRVNKLFISTDKFGIREL